MMRKLIGFLGLVLFFALTSCGPSTVSNPERYGKQIFNKVAVETVSYKDNLKLDYYSAIGDEDATRPLIVVMHGGGFAGGLRYSPAELAFSRDMAKRGFAIASISYRLLRKGKGFGCETPYEEKMETFSEATIDLLAAVNFLIENKERFKFDANKLILIGSSAGAEAVLNTVYMRGTDDFQDIDYGKAKFAGVISLAGAIVDPSRIKENAIPTMFFHGETDNLVPYKKAPHHFCPEDAPGYIMLYGSGYLAEQLDSLNISYFLGHDPVGNHGWSGWGYSYTQDIAHFINETINNNKTIQIKRKISRSDYAN